MISDLERRLEPNILRRYELLSEHTRDTVLFIRPDGQIVEANRAAVATYGYTRAELLKMSIYDLRAQETLPLVAEQMAMAKASGITFETIHKRRDGTTFPVEVSSSPSEIGGVMLSLIRDITQRKRVERTQALLREIDQHILQRQPREVILQTLCSRLAELFGYTLVWVGVRETDGSVRSLAHAGISADFLDGIDVRWDESPAGMGATGRAIRTGLPQVVDVADPDLAPWRERIATHGLQSFLSLPLVAQSEILGTLSLYSANRYAFDADVIDLLISFADQVAISLLAARDQEQIRLQTAALEAAANAVVITDLNGQINWVNPAWTALTGYLPDEVIGRNPRILKSGKHEPAFYQEMWDAVLAGRIWRGELYNRRKDGSLYVEEQTITPVRAADGTITHFIAIKQDVTERRQQEEQLRYLALHDPVTRLPNRYAFQEALTRAGGGGAVLLLDVDNFQRVNNQLGHAAADRLLMAVAGRMREALRPCDLLARWGGDEFAALLPGGAGADLEAMAERVRLALAGEPFAEAEQQFALTVSIGAARFGPGGADEAMGLADRALHAAKLAGRDRVVVLGGE